MRTKVIQVASMLIAAANYSAARAETYSTLANFPIDGSSDTFIEAPFDFGFSFSQIDRVLVELTSKISVGGGVCTGSACTTWFFAVNIDGPQDVGDFRTYQLALSDDQYPSLYGTFSYNHFDHFAEAIVSPPNGRFDLETGNYVHDPWPEFLRTGGGKVRVSQIVQVACTLNCDSVNSGVFMGSPAGISDVRVTVEGEAAPEPSEFVLITIGTLPINLSVRRRKDPTG